MSNTLTLQIPISNNHRVQEQFQKVQKKVKRMGFSLECSSGIPVDVPYIIKRDAWTNEPFRSYTLDLNEIADGLYRGEHKVYYERRYQYEITHDSTVMKFDGWQHAATIDYTTDSDVGNFVKKNPDFEGSIPRKYRETTSSLCEHCNSIRHRNRTFVLFHEEKGFKQVGSTCVVDFIGHDVDKFLRYCYEISCIAEWQEESYFGCCGSGQASIVEKESFLCQIAALIDEEGWLSRGQAYKYDSVATVDVLWNRLFPIKGKRKPVEFSEEHTAKVKKALVWIEEQEPSEEQDYLYSLQVCCSLHNVERKHAGLVASLIVAYDKDVSRKFEQRNLEKSQHQGTIKERLKNLRLQYIRYVSVESMYGTKYGYTFYDESSNVYMWWSTNHVEVEIGAWFDCDATVKQHSEYKGIKQTVLTRLTVK